MSMPTRIKAKYLRLADGKYCYIIICPECGAYYQYNDCKPDPIEYCDCGFTMRILPENEDAN